MDFDTDRGAKLTIKPPAWMADVQMKDRMYALADHYIMQWDVAVTRHHGELVPQAKVYIDGEMHRHHGFIVDRNSWDGAHCEICRAANQREFEARTKRPVKQEDVPRISYELTIQRRVFPRRLIDVPLPVPRNSNPRIQKKWAKRAAGKTTKGYQTEEVQVRMTKTALNVIRKEVSVREARARRRGQS